jgi:hypothetical protein
MPLWNTRAEDTMRYTPKNLSPVALASTLLNPDYPLLSKGLQALTLDIATGTLVLVGPLDVLHQMERILRQMDHKPREVRIEFRLQKNEKDLWKGEVPAAQNNKPTEWSRNDFHLTFTPHINGDDTLSLVVETASQKRFIRLAAGQRSSLAFDEGTLIVKAGQPSR